MKGHLIIAGGNIKSKSIYERFVELAGGDRARLAIVPTATKAAEEAIKDYTDIFVECGVCKDKIISIRVDPDTESGSIWKSCGDDYETLDFLDGVTGVWFAGGDQIRISRGFKRKDGTGTRLLDKMNDILEAGGVLGGSSAGAAIMSEIMIGGGTSFGALSMHKCRNYIEYRKKPELEETGVLLIMRGLGFFEGGVIDQHFEERSRIGRLLEALFSEKVNRGFGISEDTAIVYDIEKGLLSRVGSGGVTIIDISDAVRSKISSYSKITDIKISCLTEEKDIYKVDEDEFCLAAEGAASDKDYCAYSSYLSKIIFSPCDNSLEISLCSNQKKMYCIKSYQVIDKKVGYEIRLYNKKDYAERNGRKSYSFAKAYMDILPVMLKDELLEEAAD